LPPECALYRLVLRPVPRAGAVLLLLAAASCLALGGLLAGTAAFGTDDHLVFLNDASQQRATAQVNDDIARYYEVRAIRERGPSPRRFSRSVAETHAYYDAIRAARDEDLQRNAQRWRRTQMLLGGWLGAAGLGLAVTGIRQWPRARNAPAG
jgi:hypothetical protein